MPTAALTETMRTLHRIHRQLADLTDRLAAGPRQIAARTAQVAAAEAARTEAQELVKKAKLAADQKQLQLKSAETKIKDLQGKLNACKTNREYQTLTDQIAADTMATKVLEDEILEAFERVDALKAQVPATETAVTAARGQLAEIQARVAAETGDLEGEVKRLKVELEATEKDLPADMRALYDRAVKQKGADAMAALDGESCGGCFRQITGNMYADLLIGKVLTCRSCGRLLYLPERASAG